MDEVSSSADLTKTDGYVDVPYELEFLDTARSSGVDTTELEKLLFSNIAEYHRRKRLLMNYSSMDIQNESHIQEIALKEYDISAQYQDVLDLSEKDEIVPTERTNGQSRSENANRKKMEHENEPKRPIGPNRENMKSFSSLPRIKTKMIQKKVATIVLLSVSFIIFLFLGITFYLLFDDVEENGNGPEQTSDFLVSDSSPLSGSTVTLNAKFNKPGVTYLWDIFPEDYRMIKGTSKDPILEIYFKKAGTYRVDLEVNYKGIKTSNFVFILVTERVFILSREHYSDTFNYDQSGDLLIENIDNILKTKDTLSYKKMYVTFRTEPRSPAVSTTGNGLILNKDGLGTEYRNLERTSQQKLTLEGYLERPNGMRSPLLGSTDVSQTNFIDVYNKRPNKMVTVARSDLQFQAIAGTTVNYRIDERATIYNDLSSDLRDFRIEDISEGRDLKVGMSGTTQWSGNELEWTADEVELLRERVALRVQMKMSTSTMRSLDLKVFRLSLWLSDDLPVAARTVLNISSENDIATPYTLNHFQELASFVSGTEVLIYGDANTKHEMKKKVDEVYPETNPEFHTDWTYYPKVGNLTTTIPSGFDVQEAISRFENNPEFKAFKRSNPTLFGVISNYSNYGNKEQWKFSLAEEGDEIAWNQTVRRAETDRGFPDKIEPVGVARSDIGMILTFSGAEHSLKNLLWELERPYYQNVFGPNPPSSISNIDTNRCSLGTKADMRYPMMGLINPGLVGKIPMCFYIEGFDGTFKVGTDMTNGQLSFAASSQITKV